MGNTFQQGFEAAYLQEVHAEVRAGVASPDFILENSNNTTATQISQLQSEIESGCDVIVVEPSSATAFCPEFKKAFDAGIIVIANDPVECNYAITLSFDVYENSYELASHLVAGMGYKGNIIEITGVPGVADAATATNASNAAIAGHPNLHVVGVYTGDWTASIAQTATAQWLATHPATVNGIVDEGAMGVAAETAFAEAGRPLPKVSLQEGDCQELAFEKLHPSLVTYMTDQAPAPSAYMSMDVALRMLAGQRPATDTILYPIPGPTAATFNQWWTPSMKVTSSCFASPKPALPALTNYLPQFFSGGTAVTSFPQPS
jgi:ribose transport system substrate-binding protein